jgi:hypothetical protein
MKSKSNTSIVPVDPNQSLQSALADGTLTPASHSILIENLDTQAIAGAQGVSADDLPEDRVTLVVPVVDATGSRKDEAELMRVEYNKMLEALKISKGHDTILVSGWLFGMRNKLLHGFVHLEDAVKLTVSNYDPDGMTAMFDCLLDVLRGAVSYAQSLIDQGLRVKVVIPILTDGEDNSSKADVSDVRTVVTDLIAREIYVFSMVAFGSGFAQRAAADMGFPPLNVIEVDATGQNDQQHARDIRHAFELVSSSIIRQSQTAIGNTSGFFN